METRSESISWIVVIDDEEEVDVSVTGEDALLLLLELFDCAALALGGRRRVGLINN